MPYRRYPLSNRVVDVETARRAVAEVVRERDALARQLERTQAQAASLERQLQARTAENAHLARTVQLLEARAAREKEPDQALTARFEEQLEQLRRQNAELERRLARVTAERDELAAERDRLDAALRSLQAEMDDLRAASPERHKVQQLAADLANLRRHQETAVERGIRSRTDRLLQELVSVRDAVERARASLPPDAAAWHDGLLAVVARVDSILESEGVTVVGAPGERFDPAHHEAVGTTRSDSPGSVVEVVSSGLVRQDGTVLTPAKVIVGVDASGRGGEGS